MADVLTPEQRKRCMSRIRGKNTKPEMIVRSVTHRMGYRHRLHRKDLPEKPDLVEVLLILFVVVILGQVLPYLIQLMLIKMVWGSFGKIDAQFFDPREDLCTGSVHYLGGFV